MDPGMSYPVTVVMESDTIVYHKLLRGCDVNVNMCSMRPYNLKLHMIESYLDVYIQSQSGHMLVQDQTESRVMCLCKHVPKIRVSLTERFTYMCFFIASARHRYDTVVYKIINSSLKK